MWIYRGDVTFSVEATGVSILRMAKNILFWLGLTSNFIHFSISVISTPKCLHLCKHFGSDIEMVDLLDRYSELFSKEASSDKMTAFVRLSSSLMLL